ncbi:MAG: long-chain fatty acid--CoA ligase [Bacteroidales bacterium]|nr:long-chain fatty acid--CoA ligase [Bacteroidales bacterium]
MAEIKRIFDLLDLYKNQYNDKSDVFGSKENGEWIGVSASTYIQMVNVLSSGLLALGLKKGDNVATIMNNRPEWNFLDMALMQIGAVQIPIYPTISTDNYKYIFEQAEIKYAFINNEKINCRLQPFIKELSEFKELYSVDPVSGVKSWEEIIKLGTDNLNIETIDKIKESITEDDIATIIFTSGTTGFPKGAMISHGNFVSNFLACAPVIAGKQLDKALSFLPLCHVYERLLNYMYQYCNVSVYYAVSIEKVGENIREISPDIFCAVPRLLEKTYDKIIAKGRNLTGIKKFLFFWAVRLGRKFDHHTNNTWYNFRLGIARKLIFSKWTEALGGKLQIIVSGGAALHPDLARVFWAAGISVMEGYGLTETSPVIAVNNFEPKGTKIGTVGPVVAGVSVRIAEDGEILVKGPNVMKGYYKDPVRTAEMIDKDGWLHTGDIGMMDEGRYLKITDRKKEIFKTSGGKYVAPQQIENKFKSSSFIENIMVVGEFKKYTAAIIVPEFSHVESWCKIKGIEFGDNQKAIQNKLIIKRFAKEVAQLNKGLDKVEKIKKFRLISDIWSSNTGELSPTLKLKRKDLLQHYKDIINSFYPDEIYEE